MTTIPRQKIYELLGGLEGKAALYVEDLSSGELFTVCADEVHVACSLVKVPIMALLLKDAEEDGTRLEEKITIPLEKRVGGTGLICHLEPEVELSWRDVMKLMVMVSDNSATNAVIDLLGIERINAFFKSIGLTSTELQRKMMDMEAIKAGRNNYTTAADMGRLLKLAATGSLVSRKVSDAVIDTMSRQLYTSKLPALLPGVAASSSPEEKWSPLPGTVTVANKTGDLPRTEHDVGLFILPGGKRYVVAMLTSQLASEKEGIACIAKVSKIIYDALSQ